MEQENILLSVKKLLGVGEDYDYFDTDLMIHINSVLAVLTQLGVGLEVGSSIKDGSECWSDLIVGEPVTLGFVKSYVYLKVKLLFDPPSGSALMEAIDRQISELEWRIKVEAERSKIAAGEKLSGS